MSKCTYRANTACRMPKRAVMNDTFGSPTNCQLCLIGQLCDETSLNTSAIMEISMKQLVDRYENIADKYPEATK